MQRECDICGRETTVSLCRGYYEAEGRYVPFEGWLCAECHHSGPKAKVQETDPIGEVVEILPIETDG